MQEKIEVNKRSNGIELRISLLASWRFQFARTPPWQKKFPGLLHIFAGRIRSRNFERGLPLAINHKARVMAESKKRKVVTRDVEEAAAVVSGDEFDFADLDGTLADDDDSASESEAADLTSGAEDDSDALSIGSDEVPGEDGEELLEPKKKGQLGELGVSLKDVAHAGKEDEVADEEPEYKIVKDANGNDRYVYQEIDPGDDSDYSVPDNQANSIGNIPLSFYDTYPHIGYNINGKKIMRPAKG